MIPQVLFQLITGHNSRVVDLGFFAQEICLKLDILGVINNMLSKILALLSHI